MFIEGSGVATKVCVPAEQNSKLQGPLLRKTKRLCNLKKGDEVLIRLVGRRSQYNFPARRETRDDITISDANATLIDPIGDKSLTYIGIPLGELDGGHYEIEAKLSDSVVQAEVLKQYGDSYAVWEAFLIWDIYL
ncbi:hypothetical protein TSTA_011330 [Talaromyces stipitatus ATCC 10500]|uniref:Uncharacterized protein n=1 Tax=Talaromyces stipitatus (strain ATCC 10500 / CBS 375.48 / QM 6759 / NRRL 1006) TaxID=441959 RepID=B8MHP3_TALSN|nr:uncharacterized protein TSTA_011330 [Talaromyces stipitatus ATCC 10500]EED16024.1 hypothetical protein TSTA_011330 [Talaromyces stipitatus ATCC 10500]